MNRKAKRAQGESMNETPLQDRLPIDHGARICFGCGADNRAGLQIKSHMEGDHCICTYSPKPHQTAFPGAVNGGVIATLLDCHAVWTAIGHYGQKYGEQTMFVTRKLTVEYLAPTPIDRELTLDGIVVREGNSSVTVQVSLLADGRETARAELVGVRHERVHARDGQSSEEDRA